MSYRVYVHPQALKEAQTTPGNVRQRLKQALIALEKNPRPANSKSLDEEIEPFEPRRIRLGDWRIIYAIKEDERWVEVLAVRKRPPLCGFG